MMVSKPVVSKSIDVLSLRPARTSDMPLIEQIYQSARPDLQWIDGEQALIETVRQQQWSMMQQSSGEQHPNAMHFMVERAGSNVGTVMVDFGHNEARVIFIAMLPQARGQGYGRLILQQLQVAARKVGCPLSATVWRMNHDAQRLYLALGFRCEEQGAVADKWVWYPSDS
ncbi:MAG: GNAT family N-acetyltransferase [Metakosakonia sp.]|nr:GNAT family N-acetyltransferase [Phytobacter sp.]MBV8875944.1 GNAT family N-acetyltransferase [Phytobacter sp.]